MKKTLGGDRLGSGKKMQVDLHNYGRSSHDLGYIWRSTMSSGTLVPFMSQVALPGDTFDINLDCDVKTHPTIGPLFGSYKVQLDVFQAPMRLYQGQLHNNKLGIGMNMANVKLPVIRLQPRVANTVDIPEDVDNSQINPSCILKYLGLSGIGIAINDDFPTYRDFNAIPLLSYWDIYKNYYANKQEEIGYVVHSANPAPSTTATVLEVQNPASTIVATTGANVLVNNWWTINLADPTNTQDLDQVIVQTNLGPILFSELGDLIQSGLGQFTIRYNFARWGVRIFTGWNFATEFDITQRTIALQQFDLSDIDKMRETILSDTLVTTPFIIDSSLLIYPYNYLFHTTGLTTSIQNSQEGLGIKTYQSDLFNNWLSTEWIDGPNGISEITAIDTTGGSFTIDTLNLSKKVYDMLNRIAVSGGSYDDWLDAVYTHDRYTRCESPMYMGGLIKELVFQEVVSNSESQPSDGTGNQPLGTLAGKGVLAKKHKGGNITIKIDEPSYIMGIVSLTPRIDYSQGNSWDMHLKTMDDLHKPALDEIGFQELITEQMAWWSTNRELAAHVYNQKSAGKQPAWINYMTNVNKVFGNFAIKDNEMFMTLNRQYSVLFEDDEYKIEDLTTYIDPAKFNQIFAQTSLDSQNFWVQIAIDITARRKLSAKLMPNL